VGGASTGVGGGTGGAPCVGALQECNGSCVDTSSDANNCGSCNNACGANQVCNLSLCTLACTPPLVNCGGGCVDVGSDANNCSGCGLSCDPTQICSGGSCAGGPGLTDCFG